MSATDPTPNTSDDFFSGNYILMSIVPDPQNSPSTEKFVGCITEGPTMSNEYEEAEATLKCRGSTFSIATSGTHEMEVSIAQDPGYPALEALGLKDPNTDELLGPNQVPLTRVRYYYGAPDTADPSKNLAQGKEFEDTEYKITEDNAESGEIAAIQLTGTVNGTIRYGLSTGGGGGGGGSGGGGGGGSGGGQK